MPQCPIHGHYPDGLAACPACPPGSIPRVSRLRAHLGAPMPQYLPPEEPSAYEPRRFEFVEHGWIRDEKGIRLTRHVEAMEIPGQGYLVQVSDTLHYPPIPHPTYHSMPSGAAMLEPITFTVLLNVDSLRAVREAFFDRREEPTEQTSPHR